MNIVLDLILIPFFGTYAAAASIVVAELTVAVLSLVFSFDQISQLRLGASFVHAGVGCVTILLCNAVFAHFVQFDNVIVDLLVRGSSYALAYGVVLLLFRDESLWFFLRKLQRFIRRR